MQKRGHKILLGAVSLGQTVKPKVGLAPAGLLYSCWISLPQVAVISFG